MTIIGAYYQQETIICNLKERVTKKFYNLIDTSLLKKKMLRSFLVRIVINLAFNILKNYYIYFNITFYDTPNIKGFIILPLHLYIVFLFFIYVFK